MSDAIHIACGGEQQGPFTMDQLHEMAAAGKLSADCLCWYAGLGDWQPLSQAFPNLLAGSASAPPPPTPAGAVAMEVIETEFYKMPKIVIESAEVVIEAGAMHYMRGTIEIESKLPSVGGMFKAKLTGEKMVRPRYRGSGEIYLEPTFGEVSVLELVDEHWILDRGAFLAAEPSVEIGAFTNKAWTGLFGGEGLVQTAVSGTGKVMLTAPGPLQRIELANERLVVDGSFAVARSASLEYGLEKATKGLFSSLSSGEGLVNTFSGTGAVLLAPVPNRFMTLLWEFGGLRTLIRGMSKG